MHLVLSMIPIYFLESTLLVHIQEETVSGGHDGKWNGIQYFESQKGRGLFLPLSKLKPDQRFGYVGKREQQQNR